MKKCSLSLSLMAHCCYYQNNKIILLSETHFLIRMHAEPDYKFMIKCHLFRLYASEAILKNKNYKLYILLKTRVLFSSILERTAIMLLLGVRILLVIVKIIYNKHSFTCNINVLQVPVES